jgi:hypothetical protein
VQKQSDYDQTFLLYRNNIQVENSDSDTSFLEDHYKPPGNIKDKMPKFASPTVAYKHNHSDIMKSLKDILYADFTKCAKLKFLERELDKKKRNFNL